MSSGSGLRAWLCECLEMAGWAGALVSMALPSSAQRPAGVRFTDITAQSKISFTEESSATSNKYLIETMGGGVALFDYDNDGRLDIFFTNGRSSEIPCQTVRGPTSPTRDSGTGFTTRMSMARLPT